MSINPTVLIEIIDVNGKHWTVSGQGMGEQGVELDTDPAGLFDEAPFSSIWLQGADQEGATYQGTRIEPMDLVLGFHIFGDDAAEWEAVDASFFAGFSPSEPATIRVTSPAGVRTLQVVKLEPAKQLSKKDPRLSGYSRTQLTLRAPWPFWEGQTTTSTFVSTSDAQSGTVTVSNPTDRPMWLQWIATAPGRWIIPDYNFKTGPGSTRKVVTPALALGQDLTIDTYPRNETYVALDGSNIAGRFGGVDFLHSVPPGTPSTTIPVSVEGGAVGSSIQCRMVENWQRATGKAK